MRKIYPCIEAYQTHHIRVSEIHTIYVEESGNPDGIPVIFCHGGPGGGSSPLYRCFFNPHHYRIILFDQRGCGESRPSFDIRENTTQDLVDDMETIRKHLGIETWVVSGGSWGSTLALVYAVQHSEKVLGLILRGVFLGREEDLEWLYSYRGGASQLFPDYFDAFYQPIKNIVSNFTSTRFPEIHAYYSLLKNDVDDQAILAAKAWSIWEGKISTLMPPKDVEAHFDDDVSALNLARIECHYFYNQCFIESDYIISNIHSITHVPTYIVHGRYDAVCKPENAWTLKKNLPDARLVMIPDAGHSATEPPIALALVEASDDLLIHLHQKGV